MNNFGLEQPDQPFPEFVDLLLRSNEYDGEVKDIKRGGQSWLVFLTHKNYGPVVVKVMDSSAILRNLEGEMDQAQLQELKNKGAKWTAREVANALVVQGHPNVVVVKEAAYIGPDDHQHKYFTITMEQANGGDLHEVILRNYPHGLLPQDTRDIFQQLAYAVHHLHSEGVMHRDIKTSNCLLFRINHPEIKLVVKLADFGLSKSRNDSACVTKVGTWAYAAPELMFQQGPYDGYKVDVWSLGIVLYEMLHGYCPFGYDKKDIVQKIQEPIEFSELIVDPQNQAKDLISQMLQYDPKTRCDMVSVINHPWVNQNFFNSTAYKLDKQHKFIDPRALKFQNPEERKELVREVMEKFQAHLAELSLQEQQQQQQHYLLEQQQVPSVELMSTLQSQMGNESYDAEQLVYQQMLTSESESDPRVKGIQMSNEDDLDEILKYIF